VDTKRLLIAGVILIAVAGIWLGARRTSGAGARSAASSGNSPTLRFYRNPSVVPAFTLHDLDGRALTSTDWRGKVVLVNFWATWCGPCRAEIPYLISLQDRYRDRLVVLGISEDEGPVDSVKRFAEAQRINYPIAMMTPEVERLFPPSGVIPTSYVLDREGRLVQKHIGLLSGDLVDLETRALSGMPVDARIEEVDRAQPVKLENLAQATSIPGVDLKPLSPAKRVEALQKLNTEACTCGCDLTVAKCRIDDPTCGVSLPKAREIVQSIVASHP
jgi:thiol-disulfide isomerase/thioredoxin